MTTGDDVGYPSVTLTPWHGPWGPDDPDANFKTEVALYSKLEPLGTVQRLADNLGIPVGALVRYVLARWATSGSGAALELGPTAVGKLASFVDAAEAAGSDEARLRAYDGLRQYISWLRLPYDRPEVY
jgi:hypothetical protein